jgi:hypothetical protein
MPKEIMKTTKTTSTPSVLLLQVVWDATPSNMAEGNRHFKRVYNIFTTEEAKQEIARS